MPPTPNPIEIYYPNGGVLGVQMYIFDTATNEPVPWDGASVFSGTISIGSISGTKGNNTATPGTNNIGVIGAVCVTTNTAYTDGNLVLPTVTPEGLLRVDAAVTFPASMTVSGTVTIANTTVNVANFPAVQAVSGTVSVTGTVTVAGIVTATISNTTFTVANTGFNVLNAVNVTVSNTTVNVANAINVTVSNTAVTVANTGFNVLNAVNVTVSNTTVNVANTARTVTGAVNATVSNTAAFLAGAPNFATGTVSVTTTATVIVSARATRRGLIVVQGGATEVRVGTNGVTVATGLQLIGTTGSALSIPVVGTVSGIVNAGSQTVSYLETFD